MRITLETISDYAKHGYDLELWCRACGYKVVVTPEWFIAKGEIGAIEKLERRLRCKCKARATVISSTMAGPSGGRRRGRRWQDATG